MKKRLFSVLTALFLVIACLLTSCSEGVDLSDKNDETTPPSKPGYTEGPSATKAPASSGSNNNDVPPETGENSVTQTLELFKEYPNVKNIGKFYNGLAPIEVAKTNSNYRYGYIGFVNTEGKVVIKPVYQLDNNSNINAFDFKYNYLKIDNYIIDRQGNVKFEIGKNGVSNLGNVLNGYFCVETVEENLNGNEYTLTYYSATNGNKIESFENVRYYNNYNYIHNLQDVKENGEFSPYNDTKTFNIKDYDSSFKVDENPWDVDFNDIEKFSGLNKAYKISGDNNTLGRLAAITLKNKDGNFFYTVVDSKGNILFEPQKKIEFQATTSRYDMDAFDFCKDLCPAKDAETGLWGYIDPYGNWKIQPQYDNAEPFSPDGYATVDYLTVIDTSGKEVLSPNRYEIDGKTVLKNKYSNSSCSFSFSIDGKLVKKEPYLTGTGTYVINGNIITIINISLYGIPGISSINSISTFPFMISGNSIYINGVEWKLLQQ